jgi:hypothetical protein
MFSRHAGTGPVEFKESASLFPAQFGRLAAGVFPQGILIIGEILPFQIPLGRVGHIETPSFDFYNNPSVCANPFLTYPPTKPSKRNRRDLICTPVSGTCQADFLAKRFLIHIYS